MIKLMYYFARCYGVKQLFEAIAGQIFYKKYSLYESVKEMLYEELTIGDR